MFRWAYTRWLVSNDVKAFIGKDGAKRTMLEAPCGTQIMTVEEFCLYAAALPRTN